MLLSWLKQRKRRRLQAQQWPDAWQQFLVDNVTHYRELVAADQQRVRAYAQVFIAEKYWEGCRGFTITDEVRVTVAALAGILTLGLRDEYFSRVKSILIYPDAYVANESNVSQAGVVHEGASAREGEAWYRGPVILSWSDVLNDARGKGHGGNLVLHEFSHQLDMLNGSVADGVPPLATNAALQRWEQVVASEYEQLCRACMAGERTLLSSYGTKNRAEFFAVSTETFFEQPDALKHWHPEWYALLCEYYGQDPAARLREVA